MSDVGYWMSGVGLRVSVMALFGTVLVLFLALFLSLPLPLPILA